MMSGSSVMDMVGEAEARAIQVAIRLVSTAARKPSGETSLMMSAMSGSLNRLVPLNHMLGDLRQVRQTGDQEARVDRQAGQRIEREPAETDLHTVVFESVELPAPCEKRRTFRKVGQEVETDLVIGVALEGEEVLRHPEQPAHANVHAQLLPHRPAQPFRRGLEHLHPPAGQRPE